MCTRLPRPVRAREAGGGVGLEIGLGAIIETHYVSSTLLFHILRKQNFHVVLLRGIRGEGLRTYCSSMWWPTVGLAVGDSTTDMITIDAPFTPLIL